MRKEKVRGFIQNINIKIILIYWYTLVIKLYLNTIMCKKNWVNNKPYDEIY